MAMRTLVDLGEAQMRELDSLSKQEKTSRAALIRQAIDDYLAARRRRRDGEAFGLWGDRAGDGLAYQDKARSEWGGEW
jgi:metal-responsive CopG/Arc/MetJ family transcriptional regulator